MQVRCAGLQIPQSLIGADVSRRLSFIACSNADRRVAFERGSGFAGYQIDRSAERIGAVSHRTEPFCHLDGSEVGGGETVEIDITVIGNVDRDAIDEQRHLARVEAPNRDGLLIA